MKTIERIEQLLGNEAKVLLEHKCATIDKSMLWPLLVMGLAYTFLFVALHLVSIRAEIAARKIRQIHISEIGER